MRISRLSPRDRRALAAGALLLGPALVGVLAVAPLVRSLGTTRAQLETEGELLRRELSLLDGLEQYPATFAQGVEQLGSVLPRFIQGASAGATGAVLTSYLQTHARESEVLLSHLEPIDVPSADPLGTVALKVIGESDLEGLLTLLTALESGRLLVHVRDLRITARATPANAAPGGAEVLAFELSAVAFTLPLPQSDSGRSDAPVREDDHGE